MGDRQGGCGGNGPYRENTVSIDLGNNVVLDSTLAYSSVSSTKYGYCPCRAPSIGLFPALSFWRRPILASLRIPGPGSLEYFLLPYFPVNCNHAAEPFLIITWNISIQTHLKGNSR